MLAGAARGGTVRLSDVYTRELAGFQNELIGRFMLAVDVVGSVRVIHKLPDTTPDHVRRQHETAYQLNLKSRQFPGINIR